MLIYRPSALNITLVWVLVLALRRVYCFSGYYADKRRIIAYYVLRMIKIVNLEIIFE